MKQLIALDGMNLAYRNHYRLANLKTKDGLRTGLIFGFIQSFQSLQKQYQEADFYILWDSRSDLRYDAYPDYKKSRKEKRDEDEHAQFMAALDELKHLLKFMNITQIRVDGYEADDLAAAMVDEGYEETILLSSDRDWLQLLDAKRNVKVLRPGKPIYTEEEFIKEFTFPPKHYPVYKTLKGDKSDNIKGIMRFPDKLAIEITQNISNVEEFYVNPACLNSYPEKWVNEIKGNADLIRMNWKLVILHNPAGSGRDVEIIKGVYNEDALDELYKRYEFTSLRMQTKKTNVLKRLREMKRPSTPAPQSAS
jgi:DNA polymerase-1